MENLKIIRKNSNLTQAEVAKKLDIPNTTYATYEQNKATPSVSMLIKIADFFKCSIDYLLGHQTKGVMYLDGMSETQLKLVELVKIMTPPQASFALGYFSDMLQIPYSKIKPARPF